MERLDFAAAPSIMVIGTMVNLVAIFSDHWMFNSLGQHAGLWNWCDSSMDGCVAVDDVHKTWEDPYLGNEI